MRTIERFAVANTDFFNQKVSVKRKLTIEENNTTIVENWNRIVSNEDTVFHLGGVSSNVGIEKIKQIINQLNGKKVLIYSERDRFLSAERWLKLGFNEVVKYNLFFGEDGLYLCNKIEGVYGKLKFIDADKNNYKKHEGRVVSANIDYWDLYPVNFTTLLEEFK